MPHQYPEGGHPALSFTSVLGGQQIAAEDTSRKEGTLSLYLALGQGPERITCALTPRHVVFTDHDHNEVHDDTQKQVIMPGQKTSEAIHASKEEHMDFWESQDKDKHQVQQDACKEDITHLISLEHTSSRRIGHVLFSPPPLPVRRGEGTTCWLPDYAVIALERDWFGDNYNYLNNTVFIGPSMPEDLTEINCNIPSQFWRPAGQSVQLRGFYTFPDPKTQDGPVFAGKKGGASGLTWGIGNEIKSVLRVKPGSDSDYMHVLHWVIVPIGQRAFSKKGDSGSVVWSLDGRTMGIIEAGTEGQIPRMDLTYATPMLWIIEDIEKRLGPVSLL